MVLDSAVSSEKTPRRAGALTFGAIFVIESLTRSLNSTVLSLQAYDILGSSQKVSVLATCVSLGVLLTSLMLPYVLHRMRRRNAYTMGAILMALASVALATHTLPGQVAGTYARNIAAAIFNIVLQLYIMENIRRQDLARSEPLRLSMSTFSWMIGPALGAFLYVHFGPWGPQAMVIAAVALLMAVFWSVRLVEGGPGKPAGDAPRFSPLANVRRFISQPRLRLAWMIAFARSCFWATFFIYGPLLIVESGLSKELSGLVISASQALLLGAYFSGSAARRFGVRTVIALALALASLSAVVAGLAGTTSPYLAIGMLLLGSLAASALDGVGGIPFLRAVRPHERQRMMVVYRSYIDLSELLPALVFSFALIWLPIGFVFIIMGAWLAVAAAVAWTYLPRSL